MVKINKHCLMALESGLEQSLLRYLKDRATWKVVLDAAGHPYAQLKEHTWCSRKRDWQNGSMVSITATLKDNRVAEMYGVLTLDTGETESFEPLAKEDLIRRLNAMVDVAKRQKSWELFACCRGRALKDMLK